MLKEIGIGGGLGLIVGLLLLGLNIYPLIFILVLMLLVFKMMDMKGGMKQFNSIKGGAGRRSGLICFQDIGGQNSAKRELQEALDFLRDPDMIKAMGIRPLKGILLVGPPGTGKTLLARAAATYTNSEFIPAAGSEFIEMYAGVGAQRVRQLFQQARTMAKNNKKKSAIIFIDEIEILGAKRGSHSSHLEYDQTLNQLLVEMDGLSLDDEVTILMVAATNRHDLLDKALLRPGRFDRIVQVELPDCEGRLQILNIHARNKPLASDVNLENIAMETFGFSGAQLESLTNEAAILAFREKAKQLGTKHLKEAIDKVIMGEKLDRRPDKDECMRIAIHETGHAVISECIRPSSISTVAIVPRGKAMGYIRQIPEKDSYLYTREHLEGQIAVLLGGAVSEEEVLGSRSTGATMDFEQAIELARTIITSGLSSMGVVSTNDLPNGVLHEYMKEIISSQEERVRKLIRNYLPVIKNVAHYLLEKERISGNYLRELLRREQKNAV
ncbi:MAG: AAA family ATPase [Bacillota bacterium]